MVAGAGKGEKVKTLLLILRCLVGGKEDTTFFVVFVSRAERTKESSLQGYPFPALCLERADFS